MQYRYDLLSSYRRDLSYPALTGLSIDDDPGDGDPAVGDTVGTIGGYVGWDLSSVVDDPNSYSVVLYLDTSDPNLVLPADSATVDVTPRRVSNFPLEAGRKYRWKNTDLSSGSVIQNGEVVCDSLGFVTVEGFVVTTGGNLLTIETGPPTSIVPFERPF